MRSKSPLIDAQKEVLERKSQHEPLSSIYSQVNKNAAVLRKIKREASPKIPSHKGSYYFPTKSQAESQDLRFEVYNEDLKIVIETSMPDYDNYERLQHEYENWLK